MIWNKVNTGMFKVDDYDELHTLICTEPLFMQDGDDWYYFGLGMKGFEAYIVRRIDTYKQYDSAGDLLEDYEIHGEKLEDCFEKYEFSFDYDKSKN